MAPEQTIREKEEAGIVAGKIVMACFAFKPTFQTGYPRAYPLGCITGPECWFKGEERCRAAASCDIILMENERGIRDKRKGKKDD